MKNDVTAANNNRINVRFGDHAHPLFAIRGFQLKALHSALHTIPRESPPRRDIRHAVDILPEKRLRFTGEPRPARADRHRRDGRSAPVEKADAALDSGRHDMLYAARPARFLTRCRYLYHNGGLFPVVPDGVRRHAVHTFISAVRFHRF